MMRLLLTLPLIASACQADETISGYVDPKSIYHLTELNRAPVSFKATISFPASGGVHGTGPCNTFSGEQTAPLPWFELGPLRMTRRACADLAFETKYIAALRSMALAEVSGPVLILSNDAGDEMVFQAALP